MHMRSKVDPSRPPEPAASLPVGTKRRGNDGNSYAVTATVYGVRRWTVVTPPPRAGSTKIGKVTRRVYVVDNGGIPFVVELMAAEGVARVLRARSGLSDAEMDRINRHDVSRHGEWLERWREFRYVRSFVGTDPSEKKGVRKVWWHGGNSLLLELAPRRYLCVCGDGVFEFRTPLGDEIVRYVSVMGNSAVPYPYAVGKKNTYLMIEGVFLPNGLVGRGEDPYHVYYDAKGTVRASIPAIPGIKRLHPRHEPEMV